MNIAELDSYNLDDAVKFNDQLNPRIWGADEHLRPEVRERLLEIAQDFREFLGVKDLDLKDITISGSNAAYTYTPNSDIDLHLVVRMPDNEVYRELFDAKKFQYNEQHNIKIGGYDVELYVQDADQPHISQGIYSVVNNEWIQVPRRVKAVVDDTSTRNKFETVGNQIERAIASGSLESMTQLANKIKKMRQTGLESHGEFGPENLAFKMLRSQGKIKQLYDARNAAKDQLLSLDERRKKKKKKRVKYGYGGYWYPGTAYAGQDQPAGSEGGGGDGGGGESLREVGLTPDGVNPTTCMFLNELERDPANEEEILKDFVDFCVKELKIEQMPRISLRKDPQWPVMHKTFGRYINDKKMLEVSWGQRHIMDVLRTVAHELTHTHQHERDGEHMGPEAGETGSKWENEANARAGVLMRDYARLHPEYFAIGQSDEQPGLEEQLDENLKTTAGATAVVACLLAGGGLSGCASAPQQTTQQILRTTQDVGRVTIAAKNITRAGTEAEARSEIRNVLQAGGYGSEGAANTSNILRIWRKLQGNPPVPPEAEPPQYGPAEPRQRMRQYESASGYIPTRKQARDPRYSMALTVDIKPGQVGKEANKLKLRTNKQGQPQVAQANGLFEKLSLELAQFKKSPVAESVEEQQLDEVRMSPSALQQWANSEAAQGIRAGFEAELIFRDTTNDDDDDTEMEPDYDYDERARSVSQVIDFFNGGDYGGMNDRQEGQLQDGLDQQYMEWMDERMYDAWRDERDELIKEAWLREKPMVERVHDYLVEGMDMDDWEADRIQAAGDAAPRFTKSSDQEAYKQENPDYATYLEAEEGAEEILQEEVEQTIEKEDGFYDEVLDEFRENFYTDDDSSFFQDVGLSYMSDIASEYSLDWPYLTGGGGGNNGGSREWDDVGNSLQDVIDMPVRVSQGYHSMPRKEGQWIVEPDSSLSPDDREDFGLEIVSPPLPLLTALEKLQEVTDWANDPSEGNAYTNSSTGLHMGVSVPYKGGDVDYLKLILFLGDEYVLQSFGREANTYTKSAMQKFRENIKSGRADPAGAMALMKSNLIEFAYREIQKGVGEGKYTSAHIQNGYIEFRSAGGDWLAEESADPQKLSSTMLRYARAMQIAANPAEERQEYAKKLYKLVAPEGDTQLALFSQFSAGQIDKEQLKKQWAERTIGTEKKMNQRWALYQFDKIANDWTPVPGQSYNGYTEDEVKMRVWSKYGREALDSGEYKLVNMSEDQQWEVYDVNTGETLEIVTGRNRGEAADAVFDKYAAQKIGFNVRPYQDPANLTPRAKLAQRIAKTKPATQYNYDIIDRRTLDLKAIDRFYAANEQEASKVFDQWLKMKDLPLDTDTYGYRKSAAKSAETEPNVAQNFGAPQDATEVPRNWEFVNRINGQVIHNMTNASYNQANVVQTNLELRYPDADIYLRSVERVN
jgi:hypothetical protein